MSGSAPPAIAYRTNTPFPGYPVVGTLITDANDIAALFVAGQGSYCTPVSGMAVDDGENVIPPAPGEAT